MYSIASIFDSYNENLWKELETRCKFSGLKKTSIPHFSWQTAEGYDFGPLREELKQICLEIEPFKFHTSGLGIFPNQRKVIFLIIAKNKKLLELHELIWKRTVKFAEQPNILYAPENWIPHISLNLNELEKDVFSCSVDELTKLPLNFEFSVNKFSLLYLTTDSSGIDSLYPLKQDG